MTQSRTAIILALHKRLQALQLKNLFISRAYGTDLGLIDSHILVELDNSRGKSHTELLSALTLHKVVVSRAVAGLVDAGLIEVKPAKDDARVKLCLLTSAGREILKKLDTNANLLMEQFCAFLNKSQETKLHSLWNALCDGLHAPQVAQRPGIHPLLVPGRRQSRCMGLLGTTVFGEVELSSLEWHWLSLVQSNEGITAVELSERLNLIPATGTALARRLTQQGYVTATPHPTDRRAQALLLTPAGERILKKVEKVAVSQIERATSKLSLSELTEMVDLFNRFGADLTDSPTIKLSGEDLVRLVTEERDLPLCRGFLISELLENNLHMSAVSTLCTPESTIVVLQQEDTISGLVEISSSGDSVLYGIVRKRTPKQLIVDFANLCKDLCTKRFSAIPKLRPGGFTSEIEIVW